MAHTADRLWRHVEGNSEIDGFLPFVHVWHGDCKTPDIRFGSTRAGSGSKTMTYNFSGLQQFAMSVVGALIASSLFISAAVGPVGQFI